MRALLGLGNTVLLLPRSRNGAVLNVWFKFGDLLGQIFWKKQLSGKTNAHEFVYPKKNAAELAHAFHTSVPAMPTALESTIIRPQIHLGGPEIHAFLAAPLIAERPDGKESQIAAAFRSVRRSRRQQHVKHHSNCLRSYPRTQTCVYRLTAYAQLGRKLFDRAIRAVVCAFFFLCCSHGVSCLIIQIEVIQ
jgi:hypothetical protein